MSDGLSPAQRIDAARRAAEALEEFFDPAFEFVIGQYRNRMERIIDENPADREAYMILMAGIRAARAARDEIKLLVKDGKQAHDEMIKIEKIASMSGARRKALGI